MRRRLTENVRCAILADYLEGVPIAAIRQRYGVSESYPSTLAVRFGCPTRYPKKSAAMRARRAKEKTLPVERTQL